MIKQRVLICIWCVLCGFGSLGSQTLYAADVLPPVPGLTAGPIVTVAKVGYGASFDLTTGQRVRLLGVKVPKPDQTPFEKDAEPLGDRAKAFVEDFVRGHRLALFYDDAQTDRYGRWLVHVVRDDGLWLQQQLLRAGLARVYSFPDNLRGVSLMLGFEQQARDAERGIWAVPYYRIRPADGVHKDVGTYQLVEGRVLSQSRGRGTVYLNFGQDWKQDFTARITKQHRRAFGKSDAFPDYAGQRVRLRGWIRQHNGPMIELTHPEQIEILSADHFLGGSMPSPKTEPNNAR
jgi:endonuclease YncB( thermonuclease family)